MADAFDVAVVGGGIVGLATALALGRRFRARNVVLEAEAEVAQHQTGHNSGVLHSGLYYKPGSAKATNCVVGRAAMVRFCEENQIPFDLCGKVVVATRPEEIPALDELERRGRANAIGEMKRLDRDEIRQREPHVAGIDGLWIGATGIVDYGAVARKMAERLREAGQEIRLASRLVRVTSDAEGMTLTTANGEVRARNLVNCGGLQSDRVARLCGVKPGLKIVPFRGEYYRLAPAKRSLVKGLIYPVPDPQFPFLGVHFTRTIHGEVEAGPNAVLALAREGYSWSKASLRDLWDLTTYRGFWAMARKHWRTGFGEVRRSLSKAAFCRALQRLVPEIAEADLEPFGAGVRAQALEPSGTLVDDFRIVQAERMVHVLNAPSPAATASLSIGETIADMAGTQFGLRATT